MAAPLRTLLLAAAVTLTRPAQAGVVSPELEKQPDDVAAIEQGRRLLARLVDRGDVAGAREALAFLRLRVDWRRYQVLTDLEEMLLGAYLGDYDFLRAMAEGAPPPPHPACCGRWRDVLTPALLARLPDARRTVAASSLPDQERGFVELLLFAIAEHEGPRDDHRAINDEGEAYLARFPDSPFRRFVLHQFVAHWRPALGLSARVYAAVPLIDATTDAAFRQRGRVAPAFELAIYGEHAVVEFGLAEPATAPRQMLTVEGRPWPAGIHTTMSSWALSAGWLEQRGRQALQLTAGLGAHTIKYHPTDEDHTSFSTFAGAAALEYHLAFLRSSLPYDAVVAHQWSVALYLRAGVEKAFERKHGVAPLVWLFQLGLGFDAWAFRRTDR